MGIRFDHFRKALASGKLKLTAAVLSALGVSMTTSCLPIAMYMPPPADPVTVSGIVKNSVDASPIRGIAVMARFSGVSGEALGADFTDADGTYSMRLDVRYLSDVEIVAMDPDGAENGGEFASKRVEIPGQEIYQDADRQLTLDFDLDPSSAP